MAKINVLDAEVYNVIAAGEVVEKPASVVKELVENAIDAGSKNISVEIKNGGISFIQVSDDGCGIEESDLISAFLPHATSKIKQASDLESILTLGFRGEALASIASVAKVKLTSREQNSDIGNSISVEGGKFGDITKVSCNIGTTITVSDLFFCVPARAKFLKKPKTEEQEVTNIISRTILAHPDVNIVYTVDGKKVFSSVGKTEKEAMFSIYGKESINETLEVSASREGVNVFGYVGKPTYSKSNRTYQTLIINGRYVINLTVQTAVANAYGDFLMKRQYPFFVLYITMPPEEIDVNVHPNKLDVKFLKNSLIYSVVFEAVSRALTGMDYVKSINSEPVSGLAFSKPISTTTSTKIDKAGVNLNPFSEFDYSNKSDEEKTKLTNLIIDNVLSHSNNNSDHVSDGFGLGSSLLERINSKVNSSEYGYNNSKIDVSENFEKTANYNQNELNLTQNFNENELNSLRKSALQTDFAQDEIKIVGKIFNTYLLIEWGDNMYFIDQHAAHERIRYDKLKAEYESKNVVIQPLLVPYVLTLNSEDDQIIKENLDAISSVGFEIDEFGDRTYKISSVPAIVSEIDFNRFFGMFLAEKLNKNKISESELIKDSLMQMACKSAVKGGDDLSKNEVMKLLGEMSGKNIILFCPHGRPVVVRVTKNEIEKWFKRIV